jgi:hypothetical protein
MGSLPQDCPLRGLLHTSLPKKKPKLFLGNPGVPPPQAKGASAFGRPFGAHFSVNRYAAMASASTGGTPMLGIRVPGTRACGAAIQRATSSGRLGTRPAT